MRILIHRLGSLGDTIVALPCFHFIREAYPEAHLAVLTNAPVSSKAAPLESILENTNLIDEAIHYPMASRDLPKLTALAWEIRKKRFDLLISLAFGRHLHSSIRDYLFFRVCGISKIIGIPFSRRDCICLPRADGSGYEYEAERLLRRAGAGERVDFHEKRWFDLKLSTQEVDEAGRVLKAFNIKPPFIVISLGTKWPSNHWGLPNWTQLIKQLGTAHQSLSLVILGSADEFDSGEELLQCWKGSKVNLCGKSSPRVSAAILRDAKLFIGHDSGPMHLAAAAGTRCVAIFSARNPPGQWFPIGQGHLILYPYSFFQPDLGMDMDHQRKAIASITVTEVLASVEQALASNRIDPINI